MSDDPDPAALEQRLDDVGVHRHAADLLDLATRDRLAIGHQRQGLEQGARVLGRPLLPQPRHRLRDRRPGFESDSRSPLPPARSRASRTPTAARRCAPRTSSALDPSRSSNTPTSSSVDKRAAGGEQRRLDHILTYWSFIGFSPGRRWRRARRRPPASSAEPDCRDARAAAHRLRACTISINPSRNSSRMATKVTVTPRRPSSGRNSRTKSTNALARQRRQHVGHALAHRQRLALHVVMREHVAARQHLLKCQQHFLQADLRRDTRTTLRSDQLRRGDPGIALQARHAVDAFGRALEALVLLQAGAPARRADPPRPRPPRCRCAAAACATSLRRASPPSAGTRPPAPAAAPASARCSACTGA